MSKPSDGRDEMYKQSGVDTAEADTGLGHIIARVQGTWPPAGPGRVMLPIGYFANVIEMDGSGSRSAPTASGRRPSSPR